MKKAVKFTVKFTEGYSTFKKGDSFTGSRDLTNMLIGKGVAEFVTDTPKKSKNSRKPKGKK